VSATKKGLGRGFESLIPVELLDESFDPTSQQDDQISELRQIKLSEIVVDPDQPRRQFDADSLEDLAASIREHGILQPIIVTPHAGGYQIVAGERRFRSAKLVGLDKVPALVRTLSDQHKLEISLIENLQRKDLNVIEAATAYLKLRDQFNLSLGEIGKRMGNKSESAISNTLRLLRLPLAVRTALRDGKVNEGQVRPFVGIDDEIVLNTLPRIIREQWTSRFAEQYALNLRKSDMTKLKTSPGTVIESPYAPDIRRFATRLKTDVNVRMNKNGVGQIIISFKGDDDFHRIQKLLDKD